MTVGTAPTSAVAFRAENALASAVLAAMVLLPIGEIVARWAGTVFVPGAITLVQHLTLWVAFLGAAIAARDGKLLALATATFLPDRVRRKSEIGANLIAAAVAGLLTWGAVALVVDSHRFPSSVGPGIPSWIAQLALPVGMALVAGRLVWRSGRTWRGRAVAGLGLLAAAAIWLWPDLLVGRAAWPGIALIVAAGLLGAPIFALLGGAAVLLNLIDGTPPLVNMNQAYSLATKETLPAIPLFTLAGFVLAEGKSSERLVSVFRGWFGWMPGGTAVVCAFVCSFFTVFTGGSGITILALGGLLLPALIKEGYRERFSIGLITASGSLGLLLPPALPLILYAVVAERPMDDMFIGGLLPGLLLTTLIAAWGVREGLVSGARRTPFDVGAAVRASWTGKWELAMPVIVFGSIFGLRSTAVEAAAVTALYAIVVQAFVHRELGLGRQFVRVATECLTIVGGVLIILAAAVGLTDYLLFAEVPDRLLMWTRTYVDSPLAFLLILNIFLLIVGAFIDIFSATIVIVPLIVPIGQEFGIHPVHLGIIFIANLELGYLTPPVGMNLFLSSYRFEKPVLEVVRATLPMLVILGIGVLLITYVPWLTLGLLEWMGRL
ncbi:MAG TPA: TRAP transporter large permease subunit [Vicinamibacterales bacterium]|nr:TRAP transporter large permease subunit [Vicinamibacterales bacterium]